MVVSVMGWTTFTAARDGVLSSIAASAPTPKGMSSPNKTILSMLLFRLGQVPGEILRSNEATWRQAGERNLTHLQAFAGRVNEGDPAGTSACHESLWVNLFELEPHRRGASGCLQVCSLLVCIAAHCVAGSTRNRKKKLHAIDTIAAILVTIVKVLIPMLVPASRFRTLPRLSEVRNLAAKF